MVADHSETRPEGRGDGGESLEGGPGAQQQEWPGETGELSPTPDHGERSYRGNGLLEGKKALITGGDSGIGRAVAIAFAREGADVSIAYYDEHEDAQETVRWIEDAGRRGEAFAGDLEDREHCSDLVERASSTLGGLDLLVNNAGYHFETPFEELSPEQVERTFRINILSHFWTAREALDYMEPGSAIINTGSVTGMEGHGSLVDYASTKGAVHIFTKSLAQSLTGERDIRVNCVAPGPVWTPLIPATRPKQSVEGFGSDTFRDRPAHPVEIAPAYVFLASDASRFMSGEVLAVSGRKQTTR